MPVVRYYCSTFVQCFHLMKFFVQFDFTVQFYVHPIIFSSDRECIPDILVPTTTIIKRVNKHHTSDCTVFVCKWSITIIDIEGIYETNNLQAVSETIRNYSYRVIIEHHVKALREHTCYFISERFSLKPIIVEPIFRFQSLILPFNKKVA